jgi:hypothetical protein
MVVEIHLHVHRMEKSNQGLREILVEDVVQPRRYFFHDDSDSVDVEVIVADLAKCRKLPTSLPHDQELFLELEGHEELYRIPIKHYGLPPISGWDMDRLWELLSERPAK